jgi:peroxiredoxin
MTWGNQIRKMCGFSLGLCFLTAGAQIPSSIFKQSCDSLWKRGLISYRISAITPGDSQKQGTDIRVLADRESNPNLPTAYIIQTDSSELIFDGKFGFIVDRRQKTVKQVNEQMISRQMLFDLSQVMFMTDYCQLSASLNKKYLKQDVHDWILQFRLGRMNPLIKTWLNKSSLLPSRITITNTTKKTHKYAIRFEVFPRLGKPTQQIANYIDTYTLLPLDSGTFETTPDARDSLIGEPAASFILPDFDGNKISLSDFKGKYVLLDFWEAWCGPCRMSMSHLNELQNKYKDKGLVIIGITRDNLSFAAKLVRDKGLNYINIQGDSQINQAYRVYEIPQYFLINKDGIIIYASKNGYEKKIEELLEKHLK